MNLSTPTRYGPLQENFSVTQPDDGLVVLTGPNNAGKSALLQLGFKTLIQNDGASRATILLPVRTYVQQSAETGGRQLENYNQEVHGQVNGSILGYDTVRIAANELPRLLLNHNNYIQQVARLNSYLEQMGFAELALKGSQLVHFEEVPVQFQGSGLRSLFTILAALTDDALRSIFIDEPELSLEPRLQKGLRDLIQNETRGRAVIISTHSHLFLHRQQLDANYIVRHAGGLVSVDVVTTRRQLMDLTFELLGNDTEDLFFPGNYLIVEGPSDQVVCERVLELLEVPEGRVKVLAAGGITKVNSSLSAVCDSLVPLVVNDSPYAKSTVALIDRAAEGDSHADELRKVLGGRLFELTEPSLEMYLPAALYEKAGRSKEEDLARLAKLKGDFSALRRFKQELSTQLAGTLVQDDLPGILVVVQASKAAAGLA